MLQHISEPSDSIWYLGHATLKIRIRLNSASPPKMFGSELQIFSQTIYLEQ